jgi:hypothetical protein
MTDFTITTKLELPRPASAAVVPTSWAQDRAISFAALGFLGEVFSYTQPDSPCRSDQLSRHPSNPPMADLLADLVEGGYLIPAGEGRYELVHPDRLPPLPQERTR